jgi:hypothetical protein
MLELVLLEIHKREQAAMKKNNYGVWQGCKTYRCRGHFDNSI